MRTKADVRQDQGEEPQSPGVQPCPVLRLSAKLSLPTAEAALPELRRNKERAVRRVCGVLDSKILPMRRVMPDREAVGQHRPPIGWRVA